MAQLTRPIEKLLKKNTKFKWDDEQQNAFNKIKLAFEKASELFLIRQDYNFGIEVDAAYEGLGARLFQYNNDTEEKFTLAYASRALKGAEKNYHITDLECLALVWALRKWYVILMGRRVLVYTDHLALKYLSTCVSNSNRIARWWMFLQEFDLDIRHIPGKENLIADQLSRNNNLNKEDRNTKTIAIMCRPDEGIHTDTDEWIPIIHQVQIKDEELQYKMRENSEQIYVRDGLIGIITNESEKIMLPKNITWQINSKKFINC